MLTSFRTPGVYIDEIPVFPPSVAEVETAIPAFIGYTMDATKKGENILMKPTKISSLKEYEDYFGETPADDIKLTLTDQDGKGVNFAVTSFTAPTPSCILHYCMQMFYANGGGPCYIVAVDKAKPKGTVVLNGAGTAKGLDDGLSVLAKEDEPTLIVIPEAVNLSANDYSTLVGNVLTQCNTLQDRFGVFDVYDGDTALDPNDLSTNRSHYGTVALKYGAAYYPFLKTSLNYFVADDEKNVGVTIVTNGTAAAEVTLDTLQTTKTAAYNAAKDALRNHPNSFVVLPPSGAVVGRYAFTDANRGVWKAPAGMSLNAVIEPAVRLTDQQQGDLNIDSTGGISINAVRAFAGKGTLIWGARTLAGNDNEWRYISVRRFFNMVEESVKKSTYWAVFEPNDSNTWVKVRGMIENYLTQKWREGALAGATTKDAFYVRCGLGVTMTAQDILEGKLYVEIGMAVVRPAEFIVLRFFHKLQTS
jgi:hypothetical protein